MTTQTKKKCARCKQPRPVDHFHADARARDGLDSWCRGCRREYSRERNGGSSRIRSTKQYRERNRSGQKGKTCTKCKRYRYYGSYSKMSGTWDGCNPACKKCIRAAQNKAYADDRENRLQKVKDHYAENREELGEQRRERYRTDPEFRKKKIESALKYASVARSRRKANPVWAFADRIRNLLRIALNRRGLSKRGKTFDLLGYTPQELWSHLSVYLGTSCEGGCGEIISLPICHIDHIIPLAVATTEDEIVALNALSNLRLLCAACNHKKHTKEAA